MKSLKLQRPYNNLNQKRILIVDDEPYNLMGLEMVLSHTFKLIGIKEREIAQMIDQASNGQEALEMV